MCPQKKPLESDILEEDRLSSEPDNEKEGIFKYDKPKLQLPKPSLVEKKNKGKKSKGFAYMMDDSEASKDSDEEDSSDILTLLRKRRENAQKESSTTNSADKN